MGDRTLAVNIRVQRDLWFRFKQFAHSHNVTVERAIEVLLRETLANLKVPTGDEETSIEKEPERESSEGSAVARRLDPSRYVKA